MIDEARLTIFESVSSPCSESSKTCMLLENEIHTHLSCSSLSLSLPYFDVHSSVTHINTLWAQPCEIVVNHFFKGPLWCWSSGRGRGGWHWTCSLNIMPHSYGGPFGFDLVMIASACSTDHTSPVYDALHACLNFELFYKYLINWICGWIVQLLFCLCVFEWFRQ